MPRVYHLMPTSRPTRALRVLAEAEGPLTEHDVYLALRFGEDDNSTWEVPLGILVNRRFATEEVRPGQRHTYRITPEGRQELLIVQGEPTESLL